MSRAIITPALLKSLRTNPHLPANSWYFIASTALSTLNRPEEIPKVFKHAIAHGPGQATSPPSQAEQMQIARRTREALVKSSAIIGLAKSINALFVLKEITPKHLLDEPLGYSPTGRAVDLFNTPSSQIFQRGQRFFDQVYGKVSKRVMGQMDRSGTEDLGLLARIEYGFILSPTGVLDAAETSAVILASLIPQDVNPQLKGHLVGAVNNGASKEEVAAVRQAVIEICEAAGMKRLKGDEEPGQGWGWREEVAMLKEKTEGATAKL